jgi:hypothetical protein
MLLPNHQYNGGCRHNAFVAVGTSYFT